MVEGQIRFLAHLVKTQSEPSTWGEGRRWFRSKCSMTAITVIGVSLLFNKNLDSMHSYIYILTQYTQPTHPLSHHPFTHLRTPFKKPPHPTPPPPSSPPTYSPPSPQTFPIPSPPQPRHLPSPSPKPPSPSAQST